MTQSYITRVSLLISLLLIPFEVYPVEHEAFRESVIIFNTICAKCHEAQCSGRLTFGDAYEASVSHIIRHYGKASEKEWLQKELFSILNHMKEKCAFYPMSVPVPAQRIWNNEILEKMTTLLERNYFIPIGPFTAGQYKLELQLAEETKLTVHLVSETFDMVIEDCYLTSDQRLVIPFSIEEPGNYYVRVYPRKPVQITDLAISDVDLQ